MEHFINNLRQPFSIILLFIIGACLLGYGYPAYRDRNTTHGWAWLYWVILFILAIVEEFILVFLS
jgi:hypothetical protein